MTVYNFSKRSDMKKYFVVARKWSYEYNEFVWYVAGTFNDFDMAMLFKRAYDEHHKSRASVIDSGISGAFGIKPIMKQ